MFLYDFMPNIFAYVGNLQSTGLTKGLYKNNKIACFASVFMNLRYCTYSVFYSIISSIIFGYLKYPYRKFMLNLSQFLLHIDSHRHSHSHTVLMSVPVFIWINKGYILTI